MPAPGPLTLSAPVTVHNLTAWFILAPAPTEPGVPDYRVLEESIESSAAVLHETGSVNELLIENTGDIDLFIQAGDIVRGGRQDRTLAADFIVPAHSGRLPLPAFCVESARWHKRGTEDARRFSSSKHTLSSKKAHLAMLFAQSQAEVWRSVADEQRALTSSLGELSASEYSPTSLELTYDLGHVSKAVEDYAGPLERAPLAASGEVVGVAWAIDGKPSHADRYVSPRLFAKRWRKLLRAAATEALMASPVQAPQAEPAAVPSGEEMLAWLATAGAEATPTQPSGAEAAPRQPSGVDRRRTPEEESLPPRTRLRRCRGSSAHLVECFDTAVAAAVPVHVTVLAP
jgi:hypothetical protein